MSGLFGLGEATAHPPEGNDEPLTMAHFREAYESIRRASEYRRPTLPWSVRVVPPIPGPPETLLGIPIRYNEMVPIDQAWLVSPPMFGHLGQVVVLNLCHDPAQKRRLSLLRESLAFLHRLVMG